MNKHNIVFLGLAIYTEFHEVAYCEQQRGANAVHYGRIPSSKGSVKSSFGSLIRNTYGNDSRGV